MAGAFSFLGRYLLVEPLSAGGMGELHLALDPDGQPCVIKQLAAELAGSPEARRRFAREVSLSRRLQHGNLVRTLDHGEHEGRAYLVLEYVPGCDLARLVSRAATDGVVIPVAAACHVITALGRGLHHLHRLEDGALVHRDVTPANLRVTPDGEVKLLDFGLVKRAWDTELTLPGTALGKLAYMAPEQLRAERLDRRADVYAAGAILWELLCGGRALVDHLELDVDARADDGAARVLRGRAPPPSRFNPAVPPALDAACLHALAPARDARTPDARALAAAVAPLAAGGRAALAELARRLLDAPAEAAARAERLAAARAHLGQSGARAATPRTRGARARGHALTVAAALGGAALALALVGPLVRPAPPPARPPATAVTTATAPQPAAADPAAAGAERCAPPPVAALLDRAPAPAPVARAPRPRHARRQGGAPVAPGEPPLGPMSAPAPAAQPAGSATASARAEAQARQASAAFDAGDFAEAARLARAASDGGADAFAVLGAALYRLGRLREAEAALGEALARDPENPRLLRQLGSVRKLARDATP